MRPLTPNMKRAITEAVDKGLIGDEIWTTVRRHGPAGYNVIEGLMRRGFLDYLQGNRGLTMMVTDTAKEWVQQNRVE